ncbi:putative phosphorylase b kinase regulatory subunit alpha [Nymphon striatum]|nr:putative phosphorylase b kinase regulatory subunit alpha [Nymphon striatum]
MRSRSNSGVRLDYYHRLVYKTIIAHQDAVTGLLPATPTHKHAWIRDNVYSILAVWGLAMAYKKNADLDEDRAKTYELEQACVKLMRGLLMAMMHQTEKVEKFKKTQSTKDSLHAKYNVTDGATVVGDDEWGHLQIDATSLFLLILAQMTASGLQIVFSLDEVAFVQNLVFYIESAYCTPDYGIWERGDKTNHGFAEMNGSSVGMAKAALEAMDELDLFGARGGVSSVIHTLADEAQKCQAVLQSMLPRESVSKEVDAALLSIIGFPAFAVNDPELIDYTRNTIVEKLQGKYGCCRFLRDGHKTAKEDHNRLYYEPWELQAFEHIECEWPLFFCYLIIEGCFLGDKEMVYEYDRALDELIITTEDGLKIVPEYYYVPADKVDLEKKEPGSQARLPGGRKPFMWAQSLYILGKLLQEGFLAPGELDPMNRRLCSEKKPDVVVQVVILAEDEVMQEKLKEHDIHVQTFQEVAPINVLPARVLGHLFTYLGRNKQLGLSGRHSQDVGLISSSKLYTLQDKIFCFMPQNLDLEEFYTANDYDLLASWFRSNLSFLKCNWSMLGRPTIIFVTRQWHLIEKCSLPTIMISTIKKLKTGYLHGTRVTLGKLQDFLSTSCITSFSFLGNQEDGDPESLKIEVKEYLEHELHKPVILRMRNFTVADRQKAKLKSRGSKVSVIGTVRRSRSIQIEGSDADVVDVGKCLKVNVSNTDEQPYVASRRHPMSSQYENIEADEQPYVASRRRTMSSQYENIEADELVLMLRSTTNLEERCDILHYLVVTKGLDWDTGEGDDCELPVRSMLTDMYEKACQEKKWAFVRHTAGMLRKPVEDLVKAITDVLVRQKQITVGLPPFKEITITRPLPINELREIIHNSFGEDESTAMLSQEILVYIAMFIRTQPNLFHEMLRIRIGLIIKVMASELARTLNCSGEEASDQLLNLSPYEMKTLLNHILSGKEFGMKSGQSLQKVGIYFSNHVFGHGQLYKLTIKLLNYLHNARSGVLSVATKSSKQSSVSRESLSDDSVCENDYKHGQWIRRRSLDGALNRAPQGFYQQVWMVLQKCTAISIEGKLLGNNLTREMTSGEFKFALHVETVLNTIPQPEYRQLMVEALMVLTIVVDNYHFDNIGDIICIEQLVHEANMIFLNDQTKVNGDATLCCASIENDLSSLCNGAAGICQHFYDSAPSGSYGTMTYLLRAVASTLTCWPKNGELTNEKSIAILNIHLITVLSLNGNKPTSSQIQALKPPQSIQNKSLLIKGIAKGNVSLAVNKIISWLRKIYNDRFPDLLDVFVINCIF